MREANMVPLDFKRFEFKSPLIDTQNVCLIVFHVPGHDKLVNGFSLAILRDTATQTYLANKHLNSQLSW